MENNLKIELEKQLDSVTRNLVMYESIVAEKNFLLTCFSLLNKSENLNDTFKEALESQRKHAEKVKELFTKNVTNELIKKQAIELTLKGLKDGTINTENK